MSTENLGMILEIPSDVTVTESNKELLVKGKLGSISKNFVKLPASIKIVDNTITILPYGKRKRDLAISNTAKSLIANMIQGVQKGYTYKLKIVYAHFPISVKIKDRAVHIENYYGERSARISKIIGVTTKVTTQGDDIVVSGPNLEQVSQTAANIEASTKVKNKDQRVFLDGVYIYSNE